MKVVSDMTEEIGKCPHCGSQLLRLKPPEESNWESRIMQACFNDECSYYVRGWEYTKKTMNKPASYRYLVDPSTGAVSPLPVWSAEACKDFIIEDDAED